MCCHTALVVVVIVEVDLDRGMGDGEIRLHGSDYVAGRAA